MLERAITVKGLGKSTAAPDLIVISLDVIVEEEEYEKAMETSARLLSALRSSVSGVGLSGKELKTTGFSVDTKYEDYEDQQKVWRRRFAGYVCAHRLRLEFRLDLKLLSSLLAAVAACEAHPEFKIRFTVKDPAALSEQLLKSAVQDARKKAETLAEAANVELGAIDRIDYSWSEGGFYSNTEMDMRTSSQMLLQKSAPAIDLEPEDIAVSDTVSVVWRIQ